MIPYQRVALYILFDALESDLIAHIRAASLDESNILSNDEREKALARVDKRRDLEAFGTSDLDLIISLDLGEKFDIILRYKDNIGDISKYFLGLHPHFQRMISVRNDIMHGRALTIDQQVLALAFAQELLRNPAIWPRLSENYRAYSQNPAAFMERSISFIDESVISTTLNNLPVPDFDDTGWLPRPDLEAELKKKILGRHPVVTILGDGGNGKTALALQVLHNLIRTNDHEFDAIIWTSAKSSILTVAGIKEIEDATIKALDVLSV